MLLNKIAVILSIIMLLLTGCIEPYSPQISGDAGNTYVVSGEVTDQPGYQEVSVSLSSPLSQPSYIPVSGCQVEILDDRGNEFVLNEHTAGHYRVMMDKEWLIAGTSYQLHVLTSDGEEIMSEFDLMPTCPDIDTVYFEREEKPTSDPEEFIRGIQFYTDLRGTETDGRYYRWNMQETWEIHSPHPREFFYDGKINQIVPPDWSKKVCWNTEMVKSIHTLSTSNLASNSYDRLALHFVDNTTTKLYIGYSVLVIQHAISKPAYNFWEQLRINSEEQGGLYETQPLPVEGNLRNLTHPENKVLGYFGASSVRTERIFVEAIRDMGIEYDSLCTPMYLTRGWRQDVRPSEYPVFFVYIEGRIGIIDKQCYDCTFYGGTLTKPEYWPW
jgi:hypothetical protein